MVVYRTVHNLSHNELNELKEAYFDQLQNTDDADTFSDYTDIPDSAIFDHFSDIIFVEDDFFCNQQNYL